MATSMLEALSRMQDRIEAWAAEGCRELPGGARLLCPGGRDGAFRHLLLPPLDAAAIAGLEGSVGRHLPADLVAVYRAAGGMCLDDGAFALAGPGAELPPDVMPGVRPPDLATLNRRIRHHVELGGVALAVGLLPDDDSLLVFADPDRDRRVQRIAMPSGEPVDHWPDLWGFLLSAHAPAARRRAAG
ncbi:MAG: hypothetical protein R3F30_04295 [Planctomycetota bacterium]